ncbi:MAG TPA: hypothetical protein VM735_11975, partial [Candidatus Kapabacteria bacterium]|nr:hypothetical protein [Candidatus Kapabacteria bacterium]
LFGNDRSFPNNPQSLVHDPNSLGTLMESLGLQFTKENRAVGIHEGVPSNSVVNCSGNCAP